MHWLNTIHNLDTAEHSKADDQTERSIHTMVEYIFYTQNNVQSGLAFLLLRNGFIIL